MVKQLKFYRTVMATVAAVFALLCVEYFFNYKFPPTFMILFVMFAAFYEGVVSTIVSAVIVWFYYAHFFSIPGRFFYFENDNGQRLFISGLVLTATMALGFVLRNRSLAGLQKALDKLKASEELMRGLIESAHDAFIAINSTGYIISWNRQAEKMFGWSEQEALGQILSETIIPVRYREMHQKGLERFMATGTGPVVNKRFEISACHRKGHEFPIEITIYPYKQGEDYYFGSFLQDISERKKSQRVQSAQFAVTNLLAEYTTLKDAAPKLIETICKHLEWSAGELWLINHSQHLKCESFWNLPNLNLEKLKSATLNKSLRVGEGLAGRVWKSQEPVWIEDVTADFNFPRAQLAADSNLRRAVGFPIMTDDKVVGVMGFFNPETGKPDESLINFMSDIGKRIGAFIQRRIAEEQLSALFNELETRVGLRTSELAETNQHLATANRLKDEFLATVSHELRTPLNVMQGHSELLLARYKFEPQVTDSLNAIYRNAKSQGHIINDLLDVSRIITGKLKLTPSKVDLRDIIHSAIESISIAARAKNIRLIEKTSSSAIVTLVADFDRLQQVLWNLLTNAVKFTPNNGAVTVELTDLGSRVVIDVIDTGVGIESSFLPYVFERFRQEDASTTRKYGGLGLGMAIARHITELHGGTIEALSEGKDKGTTFRITLPVYQHIQPDYSNSADTQAATSQKTESMDLTGKRILVVDDQVDTLSLLQLLLESAGALVSVAQSAEEALEIKSDKEFDLLLSDIGMPGQDGYDLVKQFVDTPAIALTAYANETDRKRALSAGFKRHLTKPIHGPQLLAAIREILSP